MISQLKTAPTLEPVTVQEAKTHMRVVGSSDDTYIEALIKCAREWVENYTGKKLLTQTWQFFLDQFPDCGEIIRLPFWPVASVTHIKYYDINGTLQTWSAAEYETDLVNLAPRICPASSYSWPNTKEKLNAIEIEAVCGWTAPNLVPAAITAAMLLIVGHLYDHREEVSELTTLTNLPFGIYNLLAAHKVVKI